MTSDQSLFLKQKRKTEKDNRHLGIFSCPFRILIARKDKDMGLYALLLVSHAMPSPLLGCDSRAVFQEGILLYGLLFPLGLVGLARPV